MEQSAQATRRTWKAWSRAEQQRVIAWMREGRTAAECGRLTGRSVHAIYMMRRREGATVRQRPITYFAPYFAEVHDMRKLAKRLKMRASRLYTIKSYLVKRGYVFPRACGKPKQRPRTKKARRQAKGRRTASPGK